MAPSLRTARSVVRIDARPRAQSDGITEEGTMSNIVMRRRIVGILEHAFAIVVGFLMMIVGLGLGVTMIMLPVGLVIGLAGLALFIGGMCVRFEWI
jgi:hypothetical protein